MISNVQTKVMSLYDTDYQCWLEQIVTQLRTRDVNNLDWENLIEEIESYSNISAIIISSTRLKVPVGIVP